jgi:hypothetical protein
MPPLKTCKHGIIGARKCKICNKIENRKYYENKRVKKGLKIGIGCGKYNVQTCIHGIIPKHKCKICKKEWHDKWIKNHPDNRKQYNINRNEKYIKKHNGKPNVPCIHGLPVYKCEICRKEMRHKYWKDHPEFRKKRYEYHKKYRLKNPKKTKAERHKYYIKYRKREKERRKKYVLEHPEKQKEWNRKWKQEHPERVKELNQIWIQEHLEWVNTRRKNWKLKHPDSVKESNRKSHHKRHRELGFEQLNKYFKNSEAHHIDTECVIYIPNWLHKSFYPHSARTGLNMQLVNSCVFEYLELTNQLEEIK